MTLCFLLDGYNILKKISQITDYKIKEDRDALVGFIYRFHPQGKNKVVIIFDGYGNEQIKYATINVLFSKDISADDYIVKILEKKDKKNYYCVVSDDRELKSRARNLDAETLSVNDFLSPALRRMKTKVKRVSHEKINEYSKEAREINKELEEKWLKR
ncbi:MAG: NYN domain-containing protein [Candidatus Saelkia tenebricola]|nr:NYN domain-containing protein [Candidatus Saelkia tenebricola]